ncbi:hypothetical protein [Mucilaginibacter endophyticus]|uniref:hypothetical protein n=1 Tax=Mucilaginibacter endophyticus TaxID=2675003 RepID=UPI000E0D99E7|nr:hypothetical protein [Mucilaginibacter endophyticus]
MKFFFCALLVTGMFAKASGQEIGPNPNALQQHALNVIEQLKLNIDTCKHSSTQGLYGLDVSSTQKMLPATVHPTTKWITHGKNNMSAANSLSIDYAQLVPVLVAALQKEQSELADLRKELIELKKEVPTSK